MERAGRLDEAAGEYVRALETNPTNLSALLGLERVLTPSDKLDSLLPKLDSALVVQPDNRSVRSLQIRVLTALADASGLETAARAWMAVSPGSAEPYAEWARAMVKLGDTQVATDILGEGVATVGDAALAQDMAELSAEIGDWVWGKPIEAWRLLDGALTDEARSVPYLRRFADRARLQRGTDAARARGLALERIASLSTGAAAERTRLDAARAFVEAGDRGSAERMLARIAEETDPDQQDAAGPVATLIRVMAESGRVDEAEERFNEWVDRLPREDVPDLRNRIVWGWISDGKLDRAERMLADDSTVQTLALRGWLTLYRGDLRGATDYFRLSGPRAGSREEATERTTVLALIQQIETDTVPDLGAGLLYLRRGDSARAVDKLKDAAEGLLPEEGGADLFGFAGMIAVERNDSQKAESLLRAAFEADSAGVAAPPALFYLAKAYEQMGQADRAQLHLEQLILGYPDSAILPIARRALDRLRGAVPND